MAGMLRVRRSRGAFSGVLLVLLGIWGGLIPLVGPYVHYAYTPDRSWHLTSGRVWLEILPAGATLLGGLIIVISRLRPFALLGASLGLLSGAWFAIGPTMAPVWKITGQGTPVGGPVASALEQIGFFAGLGVVIVCVASVALGRLSVVSVRDRQIVSSATATRTPDATPVPAGAATSATPAKEDSRATVWMKKVAAGRSGVSAGS